MSLYLAKTYIRLTQYCVRCFGLLSSGSKQVRDWATSGWTKDSSLQRVKGKATSRSLDPSERRLELC
jgi:hypothetical protein